MTLQVRARPLILTACLIAVALLVVPAAHADLPPLNQVQSYQYLSNYASWLASRKNQPATAQQRQDFYNKISSLTQNALGDVNARFSQRTNDAWGANQANLAAQVNQINQNNAIAVAQIDQDHKQQSDERTAQYQQDLDGLNQGLQTDLAGAKSDYDGTLQSINQNFTDPVNGVKTQIKNSFKRFAHGHKKAWVKAHTQTWLQSNNTQKLVSKLSSIQAAKNSQSAAAQGSYQQVVAQLNNTYAVNKAALDQAYKNDETAIELDRQSAQTAQAQQYNSDIAAANGDASSAWQLTYAALVNQYQNEQNAVTNLRDYAKSLVAGMPH